MACDMLRNIKAQGSEVGTIIMDNDSTTISRARAEVHYELQKKCDRNHTKKALITSLIEMSRTHKILKNYKVRNYIARSTMYAISQNEGHPQKIRH